MHVRRFGGCRDNLLSLSSELIIVYGGVFSIMEYLLNSVQMKEVDRVSIEDIGIPSVVLMERAAFAVTQRIVQINAKNPARVLCVCGTGNNGADGLAVARQLYLKKFDVDVLCVGSEKKATKEYLLQKNILKNMGLCFRNKAVFGEYDYIVDAIFGIGLTREINGEYEKIINDINEASASNRQLKVIAVDTASGINASDGTVMGCAIKADETVTFGYKKVGMILYPGRIYSGNVTVSDIGFANTDFVETDGTPFTYTAEDLDKIPERKADANKGSCGKAVIIAGSDNMGGAAVMSAAAAYRSGCGIVRVFTHSNNRAPLLSVVPEAVLSTYDYMDGKEHIKSNLMNLFEKNADCIVIGPGLSKSEMAKHITKIVLLYAAFENGSRRIPIVIDADALNIIAEDAILGGMLENAGRHTDIIITPHAGEMSRLTGLEISEIKAKSVEIAKEYAKKANVICVLKDAATVVTDGERVYINSSGNCGMATAGSGDVLTGIVAGMLNAGFSTNFEAVAMAVNLHGLAGDLCRQQFGEYGMKALDLTEALPRLMAD